MEGQTQSFIDKINEMHKSMKSLTIKDVILIRKRALKRLVNLVNRTDMNQSLFEQLKKVEECIYSLSLKSKIENDMFGMRHYVYKFNDIYVNLDPNSYVKNNVLLKRLIDENITPEKIVFGNEKDLFEERWETLRDEYKRLLEHNSETLKNIPTTDIYKCYKCGHRKCTYVEQQMRSLDEPHTIFVRCMNPVCGNTWKI